MLGNKSSSLNLCFSCYLSCVSSTREMLHTDELYSSIREVCFSSTQLTSTEIFFQCFPWHLSFLKIEVSSPSDYALISTQIAMFIWDLAHYNCITVICEKDSSLLARI